MDPYFAYAHTLSGHELVLNEDLDRAINSFRAALKVDARHYNAWYGLGSIFHRQERYELAEFHFRKAVSINSCSSVLKCYLGMVLLARGGAEQCRDALLILDRACECDPKNPQVRYSYS